MILVLKKLNPIYDSAPTTYGGAVYSCYETTGSLG